MCACRSDCCLIIWLQTLIVIEEAINKLEEAIKIETNDTYVDV